MYTVQDRTVEIELLASVIRRRDRAVGDCRARLREVLEGIERRDLSPREVRENLESVGLSLQTLGRTLMSGTLGIGSTAGGF